MLQLLLILLLAGLTLVAVTLQKTYQSMTAREVKRRAAKGDEIASVLYRAVNYGINLQILLWLIIGLSAGGFFVALSKALPTFLAFIGSVALLWVSFAWLPNTRVTTVGIWLAKSITPAVDWVLAHLQPLFRAAGRFFKDKGRITVHTGLYQKEDLLELLDAQNGQLDNRITSAELNFARHALLFEDKVVRDIMTPRRVVKFVAAADSVGPVLMDELHKSGFSRFPVQGDEPNKIVGTLYLRNLTDKKASGKVKDLMSKRVYYVNENQPLGHVLNAFIKTKHHLFIVVNEFEEISGVISIEDIIEQLIGKQIVDEFDKYDSLREVAALAAKKDRTAHKHAVEEVAPEAAEPEPEKK